MLEAIRNFVALDERLATAGQPGEEQLRELAVSGYAVVINLGLLDPRYCLADEAGFAQSLGLRYHHIPVDFKAPGFAELQRFIDTMDAERMQRCFVHCAANYRVSVFVALYCQLRNGWSAGQADAHIRRLWQPDEVWAAFINESRRQLSLDGAGDAPPRPGDRP